MRLRYGPLFILGAAWIGGCSLHHDSEEETSASAAADTISCNPNIENCCPAQGFLETVLTPQSDTFSTARPNECLRALAGSDTIMAGPHAVVLAGSGDDTVNAWDHASVIPGPGVDTVSVSGGSTVSIFDMCEAAKGETLFGGGDGTLISPVPLAQLQAAGVTVAGFANVVVAPHSCQSSCVTKPDCSGHGSCAEGDAPGKVACACDIEWQGEHCSVPVTRNAGATSGTLTIRGRLVDPSGNAIVGGRIILKGSTQAIRFSDFTGGYVFHVNPGTYSLSAGGDCALDPSGVNLGSLSADKVQDFTATGSGCFTTAQSNVTGSGAVLTLAQGASVIATTYARIEARASSAEALARLQSIADEQPGTSQSLIIDGYPAIERQVTLPVGELEVAGIDADEEMVVTTTAVAVGSTIVRFETQSPDDAAPALAKRLLDSGRNFATENVPALHGSAPAPVPMVAAPAANGPAIPPVTVPGSVGRLEGELQIAASDISNAVVYGTQEGPYFSLNAGKTVTKSALTTVPPAGALTFLSRGDPSVATGAPDGTGVQAIYYAQIAQVRAATPPPNAQDPLMAFALFKSVDDGATFTPAATPFPVNCADAGSGCTVPDQEQLVADRRNRAQGPGSQTFDQLYFAWRNFATNGRVVGVACSKDGGSTWTRDLTSLASTGADSPRIAVGPDGSFLVAYASGSNGSSQKIQVQKFSSCAEGFQPQYGGFPSTAASETLLAPMAGMPRQPNVNYTIAVSESNNTGKTVFVAYASQRTPGNDDVHVAQSSDGGASWPKDTVLNNNGSGHRYFPAICTTGSTAYVAWYDRRAGGDATAYYRSSLLNDGANVGTELNVSGAGFEDPQCLTGFPGGRSSTKEAELLCTNLPNVNLDTGTCQSPCPKNAPGQCGSGIQCDFRATVVSPCPAGETCEIPKNGDNTPGDPKYGDYNGVACARNTFFMAWASGRAPKGSCTLEGATCAASADCCSGQCVNGTCAPSPIQCVANGGACVSNGDCCTGDCEGGRCFAAVHLYSSSSSCTGPVCGEGGSNFKATIAANGSQIDGPMVCGTGTGFTPGGTVSIAYFDLPTQPLPNHTGKFAVGTVDANGNVTFEDTSQFSVGAVQCTADQIFGTVRAVITDDATGNTIIAEDLRPCLWCANGVCPGSINGGCP